MSEDVLGYHLLKSANLLHKQKQQQLVYLHMTTRNCNWKKLMDWMALCLSTFICTHNFQADESDIFSGFCSRCSQYHSWPSNGWKYQRPYCGRRFKKHTLKKKRARRIKALLKKKGDYQSEWSYSPW